MFRLIPQNYSQLIPIIILYSLWLFQTEAKEEFYSIGERTRDGIGKYYMGREISQVMGHLGAGWLERPKREQRRKN